MIDGPAPATQTVRDRFTVAGLSEARIAQHMAVGRVRVDGELSPIWTRHRQRGRG